MPEISVIVPVYQVEKYLCRCIDSILNQTYNDFELILIDDGSLDDGSILCDNYACKDNRVHVIHKKNGGLSDARNAGLDWAESCSDSEWITFVDSDDWIHPEYLRSLYLSNMKHNTLISSCDNYCTKGSDFGDSVLNLKVELINPQEYYTKYSHTSIRAWGKLYFKRLLENVRFPFGLLHEDVFFTYEVLFSVNDISVIKNELYAYYTNPKSIMHKTWTAERLAAFEGFHQQLKFFKQIGAKSAYRTCIKIIAETYCDQISQIRRELSKSYCGENEKYLHYLKKRLRMHLIRYAKSANMRIKQFPYYYAVAFPELSKIYWIIDALLNKIRRL